MHCRQMDGPLPWFTGGLSNPRRLNAVIDAVSYEMHERIVQTLDHGLVKLGLTSIRSQQDIFPKLTGKIANQPFEFAESRPDGQHPDTHGVVAQFGGQAFHFLGYGEQLRMLHRRNRLAEASLYR